MNKSAILDASGRPFQKERAAKPSRRELAELLDDAYRRRGVQATSYDAAQDLQDTANHWASANSYDADSANSKAVRSKLVPRSRYETWNNGYADGIAQTYADDLVGIGPALRMQTSSSGFNQLVERQWYDWCKAVGFRRKLWCSAHAKHVDGEGLGVIRRNPRVQHPIALDWVLYETEQCQTPYLPYAERGYIDGIKFDAFGNPEFYDILQEHPGSSNRLGLNLTPERVPAEFVTHWFKLRRPGQHRGIPETTSTLNLGAAARRWRESTLTHAEMIAKITVLLKSLMNPADDDADPVTAMSTLELLAGTMTALPNTVEPVQLDAKQPTAQYEMFHKTLVNEQARPKSMPFNKAACDSSSYNYASGRLDHQTYYKALDGDREDCNELVLDRIFTLWFGFAIRRFGWLGGNPENIANVTRLHLWDWPKHGVVDIEAEANANATKLKTGQVTLSRLYSDSGEDFADEIEEMARDYGMTAQEMRKRLLDVILPAPQQGGAPGSSAAPSEEAVAAVFHNLKRRGLLNGHANGAHVNGN